MLDIVHLGLSSFFLSFIKETTVPAKRISMRNIREVIRLRFEAGLGRNAIARSVGIANGTVTEYLFRIEQAGLRWPLPDGLTNAQLEQQLFPPAVPLRAPRPCPDWALIRSELARKGVTLELLWREYRAVHDDGYGYSQFCQRYRRWRDDGGGDLVMRQIHNPGEKLFVDYAGLTMEVVDAGTGDIRNAQIFVATLGASNYTFAEATADQGHSSWIGSHRRAFEFFGGVPAIVVPDNLKSGVIKAHRYEPDINPAYTEMAEHYGVAVIPARVRKPRDKAKVEGGVRIVEQSILAVLRDRTFFGLDELNDAIAELLTQLNDRPFQKLPGCRRSAFEEIDRPALKPLPQMPYEYAEWKKARVHVDYHVEVDHHYYSVPHTLVGKQIDVRLSANTVECIVGGERIASHVRSPHRHHYSTLLAHMPPSHRHHAEATPAAIVRRAGASGPAAAELVDRIIASRQHPEQGYRSCQGLIRLARSYGCERLEAAAHRALEIGSISCRGVESILKNGLDRQTPGTGGAGEETRRPLIAHENIRGAGYYTATAATPACAASPNDDTPKQSAPEQPAAINLHHDQGIPACSIIQPSIA